MRFAAAPIKQAEFAGIVSANFPVVMLSQPEVILLMVNGRNMTKLKKASCVSIDLPFYITRISVIAPGRDYKPDVQES